MTEATVGNEHRQLAGRLRPFVARRVPESDVDDVLQDVFVRLLRKLHTLRDDERFVPWAYRVARSAIADYRRSRKRDGWTDAAPDQAAPSPEVDGLVEQELASHMASFVAALPSPYREALTLTELEGLTQRDAADMLGISLSGMKSRVQRGRERLRALFEACCEIERDVRGRVVACERRPDASVPPGCCPGGGCSEPGGSA